MPERLHPGVYVEEVSGGARPIEGVGTSTAAFIGEAARGIPDRAHFVTSFGEFQKLLGGHRPGESGYLAHAVDAFFEAGGRRAYVVRVLPDDANQGVGEKTVDTQAGLTTDPPAISFKAAGKGVWSKALRINISDSDNFEAAFNVEIVWTENGASTTVERFFDLRMDPESEDYFASIINEQSKYVTVVDEFAKALDNDMTGYDDIAAELPQLETDEKGVSDTFTVYDGVTLQFSWQDAASSSTNAPIEVTLSAATAGATAAADGSFGITKSQLKTQIQAVDTGSPAMFRLGSAAGSGSLSIEPNIATLGRLVIAAPGGANHDLANVTLTATIAGEDTDIVVNNGAISPSALAALLDAALDDDEVILESDDSITINTRPSASGTAPALALSTNPDGKTLTVTPTAGEAGAVVETLDAITISVVEKPSRYFPKSLNNLELPAKKQGYEENNPANPKAKPVETTALRIVGGSDGTGTPGSDEYSGDGADMTGLHALDRSEVNIVAIPGKNDAAFINLGIAYCDGRGDCFFLADGPGDIDEDLSVGPTDAKSFIEGLPTRSKNAAMFYPWIEIPDPVGAGRNPTRFVPPSGHMAGIFARTDITRGVWKAPAGLEAIVTGALGLQYELIDAEQDVLNPISMNCLRQFSGSGIVSWGSRTLSTDPEWRYVPVRRTALFLKESLRRGLQWAVFEPNDAELWDRIRISIRSFMLGLFQQGAFQGQTPEEAFSVQCDRSTNPQELVDQGIVTARVAFAPLKPAEFVVIEISQKSLVAA